MKRHRNDGLRKVCGCSRRQWAKCAHPWHFNLKLPGGESIRKSLDKLVGHPITNKTDAETEAEALRVKIRNGELVAVRRGERIELAAPAVPVRDRLTVRQVLETYYTRHVAPEKPRFATDAAYQIRTINRTALDLPTGERRAFGDWFARDVTADALEQFRERRRTPAIVTITDPDGQERKRRIGGVVGTNRNLSLMRAAFAWCLKKKILDGVLDESPFRYKGEPAVSLSDEYKRKRRLEGDEGERLLSACSPHLRAIVEAALETGCRLGELLSLQWSQVRGGHRAELVLPASKTKTRRDRVVPVSSRLGAILQLRRADPAGVEHPPQAYVFGNEIGQRVGSIKRAWLTACRRAKITDLHFHDLRREAGSRWLEGGVPLLTVRDWLGHTNIAQTSTYLESTLKGQHDAMRRFEEHRAAGLQPIATGSETGAHQRAQSATVENNTTNKNAVAHDVH